MLSKKQNMYMLWNFLLPATIFNFFLNGGIGYLTFRKLSSVPLWGDTSVGADAIGTSFFLPFITFLIMAPIVRWHIKSGQIEPWEMAKQRYRMVEKWPKGMARGAFFLALTCLVLSAPVAVALLQSFGPSTYSLSGAVLVKATYSTLLTILVVPVIVALALREQVQPPALAVGKKEA